LQHRLEFVDAVIQAAELKRLLRGGFDQRRTLAEISLPQSNIEEAAEPRDVKLHELARVEEAGNKGFIPIAALVSRRRFATANFELMANH